MPGLSIPLGPHFFTPQALQTAIDAATKDMPATAKGAFVGTVDQSGAKVALVIRNDNGWTIEGALAHDWNGDTQIGGKLIKSR